MTPEQFCYWLQGLLEVGRPTQLDEKQIQTIKDHLDTVFTKTTPNRFEIKDMDDMEKIIKEWKESEQRTFEKPPIVRCSDGTSDVKFCSSELICSDYTEVKNAKERLDYELMQLFED